MLFIEEVYGSQNPKTETRSEVYRPKGNSYLDLREMIIVDANSLQGYEGEKVKYRLAKKSFEVVTRRLGWRSYDNNNDDNDVKDSSTDRMPIAVPVEERRSRTLGFLGSLLLFEHKTKWTTGCGGKPRYNDTANPLAQGKWEETRRSQTKRIKTRPNDERCPLLPTCRSQEGEMSREQDQAEWVRIVAPILMVAIVLCVWFWLLRLGWID